MGQIELRHNGVLGSSGTLGLAQEVGQVVGVSPVLHDLAVRYTEHVDGLDLHPLAGGSDPLEFSPVGGTHDDTRRYAIPFGHHVLDRDTQVGEAFADLGEDFLEGVDELGRRVAWEKLVVRYVSVHYLLCPPEVPGRNDLVDPPGDGLVCFRHAGCSFPGAFGPARYYDTPRTRLRPANAVRIIPP